MNWEKGKTFPVANSGMTIPWSVAEEAYLVYGGKYGASQTLERLAERGGFWVEELDKFCPDWREQASEITALKADLTDARAEIAKLEGERDRYKKALESIARPPWRNAPALYAAEARDALDPLPHTTETTAAGMEYGAPPDPEVRPEGAE